MLRNKIYYRLKPFIPESIRRVARKTLALHVRKQTRHVWPVMPGSEHPPQGWRGWPENKKFALVLTHDVEGQNGLNKCRELMGLEMKHGFRSAFNFVPEGTYQVSRQLREELTGKGFEVGVHDFKHDGRLFASRGEFARNAAQINHYAKKWGAAGFRSGFMLHNLDWLHDLDIQYDASTFDTDPFEPQPEGRHTIFPFWVRRPGSKHAHASNRNQGYVELPYTLPQDSTLFLVLGELTPDIWFRKLDWIAQHGGMALIDTHPDYMAFNGASRTAGQYSAELYESFLEYIQCKYAGSYWHALPRQVAAHVFQTGTQEYANLDNRACLRGKRAAVLLFSHYPADPRPRRAAEALAREGVTIDLLCLRETKKEPRRETIDGVNVVRVPLKRHRGGQLSYIGQYAAFIFISFAYLAVRSLTRRYDFVHVHNMPDVLVFSALVPKALGAKIILDLHDPMPELMQTIFKLPEKSLGVRILKRLEKWSIGFADLVLTVNLACKNIYCARGCKPEKINVVLNSPDDDIFRFRPLTSRNSNGAQPFVILYHGSLVQRNGFDLAVDALERVKKSVPSARLMVCGERTAYFEKVMESVKERGLQESVQYLGVKNLRQVVEVIESSDLGIIPNHRNIFTEINTPTRIFEYLALGKPVIAPRARGIQDYFSDQDLIFFRLGDADDLAQKIQFAYSHPEEVKQIVKRGQEIYLAHTWSREKSGLLNAIGELV